MAAPITMPRMGQTVESCIISKWHKKKGDQVKKGDILFTYETDKAAFDEEAKEDGVLLEIFFNEGEDVPVFTTVGVIGAPGEDVSDFNPRAGITAVKVESESPGEEKAEGPGAAEVESLTQPDGKAGGEGRIKISPRAKNLAERAGVDYRLAKGSGPDGRIIERDILALAEEGLLATLAARDKLEGVIPQVSVPGTGIGGRISTADLERAGKAAAEAEKGEGLQVAEPAEYEEVGLSSIRKVIANSMMQSLSNSAQLTLNTSFDASDILEFRKRLKEAGGSLGLENITINDIILYAVSRVILRHGSLNAHFLGDRTRIFKAVHLGIAVDTERGLMVPTLFNCHRKSLNEISREAKELIEACRKGSISPDLLRGATFTVTNLGTLGIESFTPVLNPPQTGILGINAIVQRIRESDGKIESYPAMGLSLTFDHRALDGGPAARFLQELKTALENFSLLLAR